MREKKSLLVQGIIKIISIVFIVLISFSSLNTIKTYAIDDNSDGGNTSTSHKKRTGGYLDLKTGYLVYIVDGRGDLVTDVKLISINNYQFDDGDYAYNMDSSGLSSWDVSQAKSRLGGQKYSTHSSGYDLPAAFNSNGDSNSDNIVAWMASKTHKADIANIYWLIASLWDSPSTYTNANSTMMQFYTEDNQYLILEAVWWMTPTGSSGTTYLATSAGWATLISDKNIPINNQDGYGDQKKTIRMRFPSCLTFETTQFGLQHAPSGEYIELSAIKNTYASGMSSFWNKDIDHPSTQTTADESLVPKPHKAPDESEGTYKIVKNYVTRTKDTTTGEVTYTDDGCYTKTEVTNEISIEDEKTEASTSYSLRNWKVTDSSVESVTSVTDNSLVWSQNVPGNEKSSGTDPTTVDVKKLGGETVYLLLIRDKTETSEVPDEISFEISQSSLTKRVRFSESNRTQVLGNNTFQWYSDAFTKFSCDGHRYEDGCNNSTNHSKDTTATNHDGDTINHSKDVTSGTSVDHSKDTVDHSKDYNYTIHNDSYYCGGHTDYCSNFQFFDTSVKLSIMNTEVANSSTIITQKNGYQAVVKDSDASSTTKHWHEFTRSTTDSSTFEHSSLDYIAVLWRGQDKLTVAQWKNSASTNQLMKEIGFTVADTVQSTRKTKDYIDKFTAKFSDDTSSTRDGDTSYGGGTNGPYSHEHCSQTRSYTFVDSTAVTISGIQVNVKAYSGKSNSAVANGNLKSGQVEAGTITFYPYIKMKYDTFSVPYSSNYSQVVNVLGQYQRTLTLRNAATIRFTEDTTGMLEVSSNQWSTHARTQKYLNDKLKTEDETYQIIPGGAVITLANKYGSNSKPEVNTVKVVTYQCILEGDGLTQVQKTGSTNGDFTLETAQSNHNSLVSEVIDALQKIRVELWGNKDVTKEPFDGENITKTRMFANRSLSTDTKYNWSNWNDLYLNAEQDGATNPERFVFSTDTNGNILMNGKTILQKDQKVSNLTDSTAIEINRYTCVVDQLVAVMERNTGSDPSAAWAGSKGRWYNEAFDGVTVLKQTSTIAVGFWDSMERTTIFDTALIPSSSSQDDMGKSFYVFQFKSASTSDKYSVARKLGTFVGKDIYSNNDLDELYTSQKFYSSSITTQDLN